MAPDLMDCTVAILGVGPAACACASVLAQAGVKTLMIGSPPENAFKAGESLPAASVRLLRRLGISGLGELLAPEEYLPCTANASSWGEEGWSYRDAVFNPEGAGWHVLRHKLDAALLAHALARGAGHVRGLARDLQQGGESHRLVVECPGGQLLRVRAQWLVDATGRSAWLARRMGSESHRWAEQYAAVAWLRSPSGDSDNTTRVKSVQEGWWYSARLPQGLRVVAIHGVRSEVGALAKDAQALWRACQQSGVLPFTGDGPAAFEEVQVHDASLRTLDRVWGERWLAVGDAALAFDPLSSQGIFFALYSGIRGAEAVAEVLKNRGPQEIVLMDAYSEKVARVRETNLQALRLFALSETRFVQAPYWQTRNVVLASGRAR